MKDNEKKNGKEEEKEQVEWRVSQWKYTNYLFLPLKTSLTS